MQYAQLFIALTKIGIGPNRLYFQIILLKKELKLKKRGPLW